MHRSEIERLIGRTHERGLTLVPTRMYFAGPRSRAKVEIALARGKDVHDKRDTIRDREMARDVQRELREKSGRAGGLRAPRYTYVPWMPSRSAAQASCNVDGGHGESVDRG